MTSKFRSLVQSGEENFGKILAELLVDPVDRSIFDSGFYGVASDQNRAAAVAQAVTAHELFESQAPPRFVIRSWGKEWYHNLYHWLQEKLEYRSDITRKFYDFSNFVYAHDNEGIVPLQVEKYGRSTGHAYMGWFELAENYVDGAKFFLNHIWQIWPDEAQDWDEMPKEEWKARYDMLGAWLQAHPKGYDPNLVGDRTGTENTYNGDNMLSQNILYYQFDWDGTEIYAVSIHGGADARSGYTSVVFCEPKWGEEWALGFNADGHLWCDHCNANWQTENGGYTIRHDHYDPTGETECIDLTDEIIEEFAERDADGELTGDLICPVCEQGKIQAGF